MTTKTDLADAIVVERTLNAPVARVWRALTNVKELRAWYFRDPFAHDGFALKEFKPEVGFEFEFISEHEGNPYHQLYKIMEVGPQKKMAYTWRYKGEPGNSLVTFELSAEGEKTRLKVTHEGLETFPETAEFARDNFEKGWTQIIGSELKQFVESK